MRYLLLLLFVPTLSLAQDRTIASSWSQVKKWARDDIYLEHKNTFYCDCVYTPNTSTGGVINQASCSYDGSSESHSARASRLEWEHVVPASLMPARQFACWNEGLPACSSGGRECCERHDPDAAMMIFDLHNLVPSVGQPNALRSNKRYGLIDGEDRELGVCDFEWTSTLTEPATHKQGEVARIWLYMHTEHGLVLEPGELEIFVGWSVDDPPTAWEHERDERIRLKQGNGNPFVRMFR